MAWNGYRDWLKKVNDSGYYFSDDDLATAAADQDFAERAYDIKDRYAKAQSDEERSAIHDEMEAARKPYYYSGGRAGDESIHWDAPTAAATGGSQYTSRYADDIDTVRGQIMGRGSYVSPYDSYIQEAVASILNRDPFSYDYASDPAYQAYKKEYVREGQRAQEDTMAQLAAMTGGMPSSYAVTAAQQARDYYNAKLADKIPELYAAAYQMYQNEGSNLLQQLNMLRGLDSDAYGRWGDEGSRLLQQLSVLQGLDDTDYGRFTDQRNYDRSVYESDRNYDRSVYENDRNYDRGVYESDRAFDYEADQDQKARDLALAQLGISLGDYSGAEALGINTDEAKDAVYAYGAGTPYKITTQTGLSFVAGAQPGQTMTGGDGSQWTKNADGSVTITRGDDTWTIAAPAEKTSTGSQYPYTPPTSNLDAAIEAFNGGDHSDAVIKTLLDNGVTQEEIINAGYTGDYFGKQQTGGNKWEDGEHARYVTNTIMTNIIYGGTADSMVEFALEEIAKGREDGSIDEDEEDAIMKMLGF